MENKEKNKDVNAFVGIMSLFIGLRIPADVIIWLITLTIFTEEEKSCLIDTCIEISEEFKEMRERERELREKAQKSKECSQKKGILKMLLGK